MLMSTYEARLSALREKLKAEGLDGFIVPISDEHMSEYVGSYAQRLEWLTGFKGSAGAAVVMQDKAAMFTDGRYTIQVRDQVDGKLYEYVGTYDQSMMGWLKANAEQGQKIGYDAWLHTNDWSKSLAKALKARGASAVSLDDNPIDAIWDAQPERSPAKLKTHPLEYAGKSHDEKREDIAKWLEAEGLDATVVNALDSVAWLFNIRGDDITHTPVALAHAIVHADGHADLFVAPDKLTDEVRAHLGNKVSLHDYAAFEDEFGTLAGKKVGVDPERAAAAIFQRLSAVGAEIVRERDPVVLAKAVKNETEAQGARDAHIRDGASLSKFLHWFSVEAPKGEQDELSVAAKLQEFREQNPALVDLSFNTISGATSNGALCHYSVSEETNKPITMNGMYLVDSGGQYLDGTTDVTRTMIVGEPTAEMKKRFTQVLQGHIALDTAVWPKGTSGGQLDILARQYLWADGVDYAHGTGHGVGSYLAVHEGPQRIASYGGMSEPLVPGMICSNEPGYYKTNEYGIRIENLVLVEKREIEGAEQEMMGFETLTFAPIDRNLVEASMLSPRELAWLNDYHAEVLDKVGPQLEGHAKAWLEQACAPIG